MKKSELIEIIRDAVRKELHESLPNILSELSDKHNSSRKLDIVESAKSSIKKVRANPTKSVKYSKNPAINKILNETVGGIPQESTKVGNSDENITTDFNGNNIKVDELPEHLNRALTRNYSDVLTAIDKKKGMK